MPSHPVSHVKARLAEMIELTHETGEPVVITQNGVNTAVLQDAASYEATRRSLAMLKLVAQAERDIARKRLVSQDQVFKKLRKRLATR